MKLIFIFLIFFSNIVVTIFNGQPSIPFYYPFLVSIQKQNSNINNNHICGGTLISSSLMITAAHCLLKYRPSELILFIHRYNLNLLSSEEGGITSFIEDIYIHPNFTSTNKGLAFDIAIIKLGSPIKVVNNNQNDMIKKNEYDFYYHQFYFPLLDEYNFSSKTNLNLTLFGWGKTSNLGFMSPVLLQANVSIIEPLECYNELNLNFNINFKSSFCAGYKDGHIDACQGDSGGPVLIQKENKMILVGIVSFGYKCGLNNSPTIYTGVYKVLNWIHDVIDKEENSEIKKLDYF